MARVSLDGEARTFAANRLAIVVQPGNPKGITGLSGLARPGLVVVLCAPAVPCGAYAQQALSKAGVTVSPRSQEQDVKGVVTKVSLGEADAGIAYITDVSAAGAGVQGVDIPDAQNVLASYPIAVVKGGPNRAAARAFVDLVLSADGQAILTRHDFSRP
jgi:molybdate transport system substrate-binding protein